MTISSVMIIDYKFSRACLDLGRDTASKEKAQLMPLHQPYQVMISMIVMILVMIFMIMDIILISKILLCSSALLLVRMMIFYLNDDQDNCEKLG